MSDALDPDDRLDEVMRALAERVRGLRRDRGLSVSDLAFESGLSEGRLRAVESGRTAASLATLVALADTFEIGLPDLLSAATRANVSEQDAEPSSPYAVPGAVTWGGDLPPAPWASVPQVSMGVPAAPVPTADSGAPVFEATEKVWGGPLPPAPWMVEPPLTAGEAASAAPVPEPAPVAAAATAQTVSAPEPAPVVLAATAHAPAEPHRSSAAAMRTHDYALAHGMRENSAYVFVAPGSAAKAVPRTFSDLRTGALAGRDFRSLQEFAVASIVEGGHAVGDVARVFRIPSWRLEQWVTETGHAPR